MNDQRKKDKSELSEVEKWMENFFLDPMTSFIDQITFRIDLFETENNIIVEAYMPDCKKENVSVFLQADHIIIKALKENQGKQEPCKRKIALPFNVTDKHVKAQMENMILEVWIYKDIKGNGKNRFVIIPGA